MVEFPVKGNSLGEKLVPRTMKVEKVADPKGDRVVVTMDGKFLPYRQW
jgi:cyanate lyase